MLVVFRPSGPDLILFTAHCVGHTCWLKLYRTKEATCKHHLEMSSSFLVKAHLKLTQSRKLLSGLDNPVAAINPVISDGIGVHYCLCNGQLTHLKKHNRAAVQTEMLFMDGSSLAHILKTCTFCLLVLFFFYLKCCLSVTTFRPSCSFIHFLSTCSSGTSLPSPRSHDTFNDKFWVASPSPVSNEMPKDILTWTSPWSGSHPASRPACTYVRSVYFEGCQTNIVVIFLIHERHCSSKCL